MPRADVKSYGPTCTERQRPPAASTSARMPNRPSSDTSADGVSTISSSAMAPTGHPSRCSSASAERRSSSTWMGNTTFGAVRANPGIGSLPSWAPTHSSVRRARRAVRPANGFRRSPMKGGRVPSRRPASRATPAAWACVSSSSSGRMP